MSRPTLAALLAISLLAVTACGGGAPDAKSPTSAKTSGGGDGKGVKTGDKALDPTDSPTSTRINIVSKPTYVQEYNAIVGVLSKYIDGCKQAKSSIMKPAFSDQATIFGVGEDGKLSGGAIQSLFDGIDSSFRPSPEAQAAIVRIDIVGTVASARIDANDVSGVSFTDFFHLVKVDGEWIVISKVYHTHVAP